MIRTIDYVDLLNALQDNEKNMRAFLGAALKFNWRELILYRSNAAGAEGNSCFLGIICLNANVDVTSNNETDANASLTARIQSMWSAFLSLFVSAEA